MADIFIYITDVASVNDLTQEIALREIGDNQSLAYADAVVENLRSNLQGQLDNEVVTRFDKDADLQGQIDDLVVGVSLEVTVANIAERDAYDAIAKMNIFVTDDGDGKWALYKATTAGVGATYVKLSDPDLLNAAMSASQIKASYESNADTNAFTNALLAKLNAIAAGATANSTDAQLRDRSTHTGTQAISTVSGLQGALDAKQDRANYVQLAVVNSFRNMYNY